MENISGWGEWIYLDNITVKASSGATVNCSSVTFANTISPIMLNNCAIAGCHDAVSGHTDLSNYAGVKSIVDNGNLKKRMIDGIGGSMPAGGLLADSILSKVQCWLDAGALNN